MSVLTASQTLAQHYLDITAFIGKETRFADSKTDIANLRWMCVTIVTTGNTLPIDKVSRWLGFIQGVLVCKGIITVDGERDMSRPLFHDAYAEAGMAIPATLEQAGKA